MILHRLTISKVDPIWKSSAYHLLSISCACLSPHLKMAGNKSCLSRQWEPATVCGERPTPRGAALGKDGCPVQAEPGSVENHMENV
ncbi:MAG TPA: hypothetical protein DEO88_08700 [Syntrophobacteraceae bacterium]|nr:hypothetical protein [Syntrophobacteraceae bacterium]